MTTTTRFSFEGDLRFKDVLKSARDPDPEIRAVAVEWLGSYHPVTGKQREAVEAALRDPVLLVHEAAAKALEALNAK